MAVLDDALRSGRTDPRADDDGRVPQEDRHPGRRAEAAIRTTAATPLVTPASPCMGSRTTAAVSSVTAAASAAESPYGTKVT